MKKSISKVMVAILSAALLMTLFSVNVFAYDRQEAVEISGGTIVSVYAGTQNSNDQGNYLEDPGDYMQVSSFQTPGKIVSTSNITSSTNFTTVIPGGELGAVRGGVEGVSWKENTLTLNNARGTVITIEGPQINPFDVNTYNDKLNPNISDGVGASNLAWAENLTYYKQFDLFIRNGEAGAPHTKDNSTVQDTVYINLKGESTFDNIAIKGNVKVVFKGTGKLILDTSLDSWNYDNYTDPNFDHLSDESEYALATYVSPGYHGELEGECEVVQNNGNRIITEWYEYDLPDIEIEDTLEIIEGGALVDTEKVDGDFYLYTGEGNLGEAVAEPEEVPVKASVTINNVVNTLAINEARTVFYVAETVGSGRNAVTTYYDVTADITKQDSFATFVGSDAPAARVVIAGDGSEDEPADPTEEFKDIADCSAGVKKAISWAAENNVVKGFDDNTFRPEESATRAQFAIILWRMAGKPEAGADAKTFSDVDSSSSTAKAIAWASSQGLVNGYDDGTFKPDDALTRAQIVIILYRQLGRPAASKATEFADVKAGDSAYNAIQWAAENGIVNGFSDNTFRADENCTRAQIVTILHRAVNNGFIELK